MKLGIGKVPRTCPAPRTLSPHFPHNLQQLPSTLYCWRGNVAIALSKQLLFDRCWALGAAAPAYTPGQDPSQGFELLRYPFCTAGAAACHQPPHRGREQVWLPRGRPRQKWSAHADSYCSWRLVKVCLCSLLLLGQAKKQLDLGRASDGGESFLPGLASCSPLAADA
eukprot:gene24699-biopygen14966